MGSSTGKGFKNVFETSAAKSSGDIIQHEANIETSESRRPSVVLSVNKDMMNLNITAPAPGTTGKSVPVAAAAAAAVAAAASASTLQQHPVPTRVATSCQKRFRSRSLPNIWLATSTVAPKKRRLRHHNRRVHHVPNRVRTSEQELLLPPVNLKSMQEIDLNEVLKNPKLRHDILFDPQIQFRPNLSGHRGERKRKANNNYWLMISNEISALVNSQRKLVKSSPLVVMFDTLKSILLSLIPNDDKHQIALILDQNLILQQLNNASFNFNAFSQWICNIFKLHCAPMRDQWIDELNATFQGAVLPNGTFKIDSLITGLRTLFSILEAMKLDVANHQIRILRPLLCSNAVEFEKEYFRSLVRRNRINFTSSMIWFKRVSLPTRSIRENLIHGVVEALSCARMVSEFPNTFVFDHDRLITLRTDLRHIVCIKLCTILFKMMHAKQTQTPLRDEAILEMKNDIISIITDSNGNSKWTRNLHNLAVQLCSKLPSGLDDLSVDFCSGWLLKHTQPDSPLYNLVEAKLFKAVKSSVNDDPVVKKEMAAVLTRLELIVDFNFNVFQEMYGALN